MRASASVVVRGALLSVLSACAGNLNDAFDVEDAGPEGDGGCIVGVDVPDAGPLDAGPDGGVTNVECFAPGALDGAVEACAQLVESSCGVTCLESPGCAAAQLLSRYEPDRCAAALGDSQTFPVCALGNCDDLVLKVCGPANECLEAPGCAPSLELQSRANDPKATQEQVEQAQAECLQALEDDVVFAACF